MFSPHIRASVTDTGGLGVTAVIGNHHGLNGRDKGLHRARVLINDPWGPLAHRTPV